MKISVIIPTLGRTQVLLDTVKALLEQQTRRPDEIIVLDQNQPPLPEIQGVRHIHSTFTGAIYHMNWGVKLAQGDIVLFIDDDVIPEPILVENHLKQYGGVTLIGAPIGGVAGRVHQPSGDLPPAKIKEVGRVHRFTGSVVAQFNSDRKWDVDFGPGGNVSFRKEALLKAGGFDEGFSGNGYFFEPDAGLRVRATGVRLIFTPEAGLKHLMAPSGGYRMTDKAMHTYYFIRNGIRLYRRHGSSLGYPFFLARMKFYGYAKAIYNRNPRIAWMTVKALMDGCFHQDMKVKAEGLFRIP